MQQACTTKSSEPRSIRVYQRKDHHKPSLWKAGLRSRLDKYAFAEDSNRENLQCLLPQEPKDPPGSLFAVGHFFVKNKVNRSELSVDLEQDVY